MELLQTERLILRRWRDSDLEPLLSITAKEHIAYWLPEWGSCSEWVESWIQDVTKKGYEMNNPMEHFMTWAVVLKETDQLIGMINAGSDEFDKKEVGIGYFIDMDCENRGYATEAVTALCDYIFKTYRYDHLALTVQPENAASAAVAKKAGFRFVKKVKTDSGGFDEPIIHELYRLNNPSV